MVMQLVNDQFYLFISYYPYYIYYYFVYVCIVMPFIAERVGTGSHNGMHCYCTVYNVHTFFTFCDISM